MGMCRRTRWQNLQRFWRRCSGLGSSVAKVRQATRAAHAQSSMFSVRTDKPCNCFINSSVFFIAQAVLEARTVRGFRCMVMDAHVDVLGVRRLACPIAPGSALVAICLPWVAFVALCCVRSDSWRRLLCEKVVLSLGRASSRRRVRLVFGCASGKLHLSFRILSHLFAPYCRYKIR
jgi:hypothetical protein